MCSPLTLFHHLLNNCQRPSGIVTEEMDFLSLGIDRDDIIRCHSTMASIEQLLVLIAKDPRKTAYKITPAAKSYQEQDDMVRTSFSSLLWAHMSYNIGSICLLKQLKLNNHIFFMK